MDPIYVSAGCAGAIFMSRPNFIGRLGGRGKRTAREARSSSTVRRSEIRGPRVRSTSRDRRETFVRHLCPAQARRFEEWTQTEECRSFKKPARADFRLAAIRESRAENISDHNRVRSIWAVAGRHSERSSGCKSPAMAWQAMRPLYLLVLNT